MYTIDVTVLLVIVIMNVVCALKHMHASFLVNLCSSCFLPYLTGDDNLLPFSKPWYATTAFTHC